LGPKHVYAREHKLYCFVREITGMLKPITRKIAGTNDPHNCGANRENFGTYKQHAREIMGTIKPHVREINGMLYTHFSEIGGTVKPHMREIFGTLKPPTR